jgi:gas vesicle protein GvpA/GvpJ/GvpM family
VTALAQRTDVTTQTSLVDLLDRLLGTGVVVAGDVTISLAGVDLVTIRLRALISSVGSVEERTQ